MKKKLVAYLMAICVCLLSVGCTMGTTTMDEGKDTDGKAGEPPKSTSTPTPETTHESEKSEAMGQDGKNAAEDIADGVGNAAKDIVDGAGGAAKSVVDGAKNAVDNMR